MTLTKIKKKIIKMENSYNFSQREKTALMELDMVLLNKNVQLLAESSNIINYIYYGFTRC